MDLTNAGVAIDARDLVVAYGSHVALRHVTVSVPQGTVLGMLGPNGAGKSTFVRTCLGLLRPRQGTVRVLGLDPVADGERARRQVGFILEQTGLYDTMSCRANLELYGKIYRVPPRELKKRIDEVLGRFGLGDRAEQQAGVLSKGLRQRLALARALLHGPRLLFLDEPTSGLDPVAAREVRGAIADVVREQCSTVVLTTHNMVEAERLCDQVAILRHGEIARIFTGEQLASLAGVRVRCRVQSGTPERILSLVAAVDYRVSGDEVEFIFGPAADPTAARNAVALAGCEVLEVMRPAESLEDQYLLVTGGDRA